MSEPNPSGFGLAVHADWSSNPAKRWMTVATYGRGVWRAGAPEPVGDADSLFARLRERAGGRDVGFGIDCPLGLPRAYVRRHCEPLKSFRAFLAGLEDRPEMFEVCASLDEVSGWRPFYPRHGQRGMSRAAHAAALGLADVASLSRVCDRATPTRPPGAPLFWTLGANQSGKAAIAAWRDLLLPALREPSQGLHLWPFDGDLAQFVARRAGAQQAGARVLLAETYPAEALDQLGLRLTKAAGRGSKRRQSDRAALAGGLRRALDEAAITPSASLSAALLDGFGADEAGEDRFDSLLGLLCVVSVLDGRRSEGVPDDACIRTWEGWVLGLRTPVA